MLKQAVMQLENELSISQNEILTIASRFQEQMQKGLSGQASSLKMLPSYLHAPSGDEVGSFLAFDFGGSNVRAAVVELEGKGKFQELHRLSRPLSDPESERDYRATSVTAEELFDFLAGIIQKVLTNFSADSTLTSNTSGPLALGFAFSFPYLQRRIEEGLPSVPLFRPYQRHPIHQHFMKAAGCLDCLICSGGTGGQGIIADQSSGFPWHGCIRDYDCCS